MELERSDEITVKKVEDFSGDPEVELDFPPEYCRYRDEGCDLADSCLNCPFTRCIYDEPGGKQHWLKRLRAREMVRMFTAEGKGVKDLALMFGVSQRTVQRALKVTSGDSARRGVQKVSEGANPAKAKGRLERLAQKRSSKDE